MYLNLSESNFTSQKFYFEKEHKQKNVRAARRTRLYCHISNRALADPGMGGPGGRLPPPIYPTDQI